MSQRHSRAVTALDADMVAQRRHLPGLPAQLRRRQRRRHRRPGRRPRPPAATCATSASTRSGSARGTLADGRRRLRRRRLPRHRPGLRHAGRGRAADRRGARARHPRSSSTSCPTTAPTQHPWFQEALAAGRGSAARELFWFRDRPGRARRAAAQRLAVASSAARPGPGSRPDGASGTCTCSRPSSPTSTGTTRRSARSSRTSCGSGSTAASTASASTRPRCCVKDPALPDFDPAAPPVPHPYSDRDEVHDDLPGVAA